MGNYLKQIYKISSANYQTLKETGSLTYNGKTYKYDPNNLYLIENNLTDDYVLTGGGGSKLISELSVKHADSADKATSAETASEATHAAKADSATSATKADTASKVTNKLTAGSKTYDGSAAVSLTKADLGLGNVDNMSIVNYTEARGDNLITNGNGIMGNNYNFPELTFDPLVANNCKGSFRADGQRRVGTTEKISIDLSSSYKISFDVKIDNPDKTRYIYVFVGCYDADGFGITPRMYYSARERTTLAKDLNNGDTVIYLTSVDGFISRADSGYAGICCWNYKDSYGHEYGDEYTRYIYDNIWTVTDNSFKDTATNTIKLSKAWNGGTYKAGTRVSQICDGGTYQYFGAWNTSNTEDWVSYVSGVITKDKLRPATRTIDVGFLCQWPNGNGVDLTKLKMWLANVNLSKVILQDDTAFVKTSGNSIINDGSLVIRNNPTEYPLRFNSLNGKSTYIDFMYDGVRYNVLGVKNKTNDLLWNGNRITTVLDLANKVDKVSGKQLSTNDYTTAEKNKLAGLSNAEALTNSEIDEAIK